MSLLAFCVDCFIQYSFALRIVYFLLLFVTEVSVFGLHVSLVGVVDKSHVTEAMVARFTAGKQTQQILQRLPCYLSAAS